MHVLPAIPTILMIAGLVIIGSVAGTRAGPARGRMWAGLAALVAQQLLGLLWVSLLPALFYRADGAVPLDALSAGYSVLSAVLLLVGVGLLASAIVAARGAGFGYLDPTRPGTPPTEYPTGYPSGSPYTDPGGMQPPR